MKELNDFIKSPHNDLSAFNLAEWYYDKTNYGAATSFYLRVTESSDDNLLIYKSLLKIGLGFEKQGNRIFYAKGMYLHAISVLPNRPEGYFLLSRLYERNKEWQESYTMAEIGLSVSNIEIEPLKGVEYPGQYGFLFEKSVVCWWMGREDESIKILLELNEMDIDDNHKQAVKNNIRFIYGTDNWSKPTYYKTGDKIRYEFEGIDKIKTNHSQAFQDLFVLMATNGKIDGKYLEIGSYKPFEHSNTYLLENKFNWKGVSLEINPTLVQWFNGKRDNECLYLDATKANYLEILDKKNWGTDWDYLQLDCEPAKNTFEALLSIPFEKYRFAVITYEHDWYIDEDKTIRDKSRRYLEMFGYKLVVSNVSVDDKSPFEDWWVHPELIDNEIIQKLKSIKEVSNIKDWIYSK